MKYRTSMFISYSHINVLTNVAIKYEKEKVSSAILIMFGFLFIY